MRKYAPQPTASPAAVKSQAPATAPTVAVPQASAPDSRRASGTASAVLASAESETTIENDLYRITFTNRGAQVKSWILKKFDNDTQNGPLELVHAAGSQKYGYPLSLFTYDETLGNKLNSVLYVASEIGPVDGLRELGVGKSTVISPKGELANRSIDAPTSISFDYADGDLVAHKTFSFDQTYVVNIETSVIYKGAPVAAFPSWPAGFGDQATPASYAAGGVAYQSNSDIVRPPLKCGPLSFLSKCDPVSGGNTVKGPFHWAGISGQYFTAMFLPADPSSAVLITLRNPVENAQDSKRPFEVLGVAVGSLSGSSRGRLFVGPKDLSTLQSISIPGISGSDPNLTGLVDYGWFGLIAKPLFIWLKWTHTHIVANWGWAIVLQTLIIALALLPLRISQMKSMLKMQRVAPQIKAIQEKYKKYSLRDPRKAAMNEEVAALYKTEGVNPAGGCLPLVIQMPFLFAYYRMLSSAVELRHAPWLWIHDLSARDPLFLIPGLMILSMFLVQRLTPQAAGMDPAQQRMMMWMMPAMMGFIFINLAAGLNLYYAESNLIAIAQQAVMNRTQLGREMREMAEKRARKKDK